jgi:hypothetical protein
MNDEGIAQNRWSGSKHNKIYDCLIKVKVQLTKMSSSEKQELINLNFSQDILDGRLDAVKLSDKQDNEKSKIRPSGRSRVLKADEYLDDFQDESKVSNNSSESESYDIVVRCADEEVARAQEELLNSPENANRLVVYKKALENACEQNEFLRSGIIASRRKTAQLQLENEDMKEVIIELGESIDFMTNGELDEALK